MTIQNAIASLAVKDLASARVWYETLFGRPADSTPMAEVAEWKFERGGWLQVYQSKQHVGSSSVTLAVDNLQQQIAELEKIGIDGEEPIISERVKILMIKDPDGNSLAFTEALDKSIAQ